MTSRGLTIRRAGGDHLAAVRACLAAACEPYRATYTPAAFLDTVPEVADLGQRALAMTILVAEMAAAVPHAIVGTIAYQATAPGVGHLRGMAVLPAAQGQGVADRLLRAAEDGLGAQGCVRVTLDTTRPLERAIRFYERHGYRPTGVVADFHGMPLYEYAKDLGDPAR